MMQVSRKKMASGKWCRGCNPWIVDPKGPEFVLSISLNRRPSYALTMCHSLLTPFPHPARLYSHCRSNSRMSEGVNAMSSRGWH